MIKTDLVKGVSITTGFTQADVTRVIDATLSAIKAGIQAGEKIDLRGFGIFSLATRAARNGRNPITGDVVAIPEKKVVKFKPSKDLKAAVNG
jgi:DNA-binding protein HU-beta